MLVCILQVGGYFSKRASFQARLGANCDFCSYMEMDKFISLCINGTITGNRQWNFCLVMVIIDAAILIFTTILLCLVVAANTVHSAIRIVLANILIASIAACLGTALICLRATIALAINSHASSHPLRSFSLSIVNQQLVEMEGLHLWPFLPLLWWLGKARD